MCLRLGWTQAPTVSLGCLLLSFLGIDFLFLQRYPPDTLGLHPPSLANSKKKKKENKSHLFCNNPETVPKPIIIIGPTYPAPTPDSVTVTRDVDCSPSTRKWGPRLGWVDPTGKQDTVART